LFQKDFFFLFNTEMFMMMMMIQNKLSSAVFSSKMAKIYSTREYFFTCCTCGGVCTECSNKWQSNITKLN